MTLSLGRAGKTGRPALVVRATRAPGGAALRGLGVTLPASLRASGRPSVRADGRRVRSRPAVSVNPGAITVTRSAARTLEQRYPAGRLKLTRATRRLLSRGRRPPLRFTVDVATADRLGFSVRRTVRARR